MRGLCKIFEIARVHLKLHGVNFDSDLLLGLVKVSHDDYPSIKVVIELHLK